MKIDPGSNTPVFEQIADALRSGVVAGLYRPGEAIPSIRALALKLLINPNTITRAVEQLEREGIIESRKGLGMFVTDAAPEIARTATERSVQSTFTQGIHLGRAAQLTKARIDEVYRKAWPDGSKR
jgi:GntR family transcriptional regulator